MAHRVDNSRSLAAFPSESAEPDPPQLGNLIRTARLARHLTHETVAARAKIKLHLLEDLERNDLTRWPSDRFYREHLLRAYAAVIGLDQQRIVNQFRAEYPEYQPPIVVQRPERSPRLWLPVAGTCSVLLIGGFAAAVPVFERATRRPEAVTSPATTAAEVVAPTITASASAPIPVVMQSSIPAQDAAAPVPEAKATDGELAISSNPAGARVTVNGIARGNTPVRVRFLPPGTYTIRVIETGYSIAERRTTLTPERRRASVMVSLREAPTATRGF